MIHTKQIAASDVWNSIDSWRPLFTCSTNITIAVWSDGAGLILWHVNTAGHFTQKHVYTKGIYILYKSCGLSVSGNLKETMKILKAF